MAETREQQIERLLREAYEFQAALQFHLHQTVEPKLTPPGDPPPRWYADVHEFYSQEGTAIR
jgi:hypothetical protein